MHKISRLFGNFYFDSILMLFGFSQIFKACSEISSLFYIFTFSLLKAAIYPRNSQSYQIAKISKISNVHRESHKFTCTTIFNHNLPTTANPKLQAPYLCGFLNETENRSGFSFPLPSNMNGLWKAKHNCIEEHRKCVYIV